jgi:uncharacterized protein (DUF58 family)
MECLARAGGDARRDLPPLLAASERLAAAVSLGVHGRRKSGMGETFWQFRRYRSEDPSTAVDWRQSAKSQHLFVREREWEASEAVWFWRDGSANMRFKSDFSTVTKIDRATVLALALGFAAGARRRTHRAASATDVFRDRTHTAAPHRPRAGRASAFAMRRCRPRRPSEERAIRLAQRFSVASGRTRERLRRLAHAMASPGIWCISSIRRKRIFRSPDARALNPRAARERIARPRGNRSAALSRALQGAQRSCFRAGAGDSAGAISHIARTSGPKRRS